MVVNDAYYNPSTCIRYKFHTYLIVQSIKAFEDELKKCSQVLRTWCSHKNIGIPVNINKNHSIIYLQTCMKCKRLKARFHCSDNENDNNNNAKRRHSIGWIAPNRIRPCLFNQSRACIDNRSVLDIWACLTRPFSPLHTFCECNASCCVTQLFFCCECFGGVEHISFRCKLFIANSWCQNSYLVRVESHPGICVIEQDTLTIIAFHQLALYRTLSLYTGTES